MRNKIIFGNWKLNNDLIEGLEFFAKLRVYFQNNEKIKMINEKRIIYGLAPQAPLLKTLLEHCPSESLIIAQNVFQQTEGAYTGEISPYVLLSIGIQWVIIGHSERRDLFKESNEVIKAKVDLALKNGLNIVLCCGEHLETREERKEVEFVINQLQSALKDVTIDKLENIYIAYEPIWAIGTGKTATANDAEIMCQKIRSFIHKKYTEEIASRIHILYGGSVKPQNIKEICAMKNVDGVLVGGASVKADSFIQLLENC